jgi:hypothetical protein
VIEISKKQQAFIKGCLVVLALLLSIIAMVVFIGFTASYHNFINRDNYVLVDLATVAVIWLVTALVARSSLRWLRSSKFKRQKQLYRMFSFAVSIGIAGVLIVISLGLFANILISGIQLRTSSTICGVSYRVSNGGRYSGRRITYQVDIESNGAEHKTLNTSWERYADLITRYGPFEGCTEIPRPIYYESLFDMIVEI